MKSQTQIVLEQLRKRPVTAMYAFDSLGIINLSGRIAELRRAGHAINSEWVDGTNRYGDPVRFVRYILMSEPREAA